MVAKILLECERLAGLSLSTQRKLVMDAFCVTPFDKDDELYQFEITAETLMTSKTPLAPIAESPSHASKELPDIFPMKCNISIPAGHLYKPRNIYRKSIGWKMYHFFPFFTDFIIPSTAISTGSRYFHPHTAFFSYSQEVTNLHETPVTQTQFESRALLKAFGVAAASAQSKYGVRIL